MPVSESVNTGLELQIVPNVMIKNITISQVSDTRYESKVNLLMKEKFSNEFNAPTWFGVNNFSEYMKVIVIQTHSPASESAVVKLLQSQNTRLREQMKHPNLESFVGSFISTGDFAVKSVKDIKRDIGAGTAVGDSAAIQEYHSTIDISGDVIYDIPYEATFKQANKNERKIIEYLSYIVYVDFDLAQVMKDHDTTFSVDNLGVGSLVKKFRGEIKRLIAVVGGVKTPVIETYTDSDGNAWHGAKYTDPDTGDSFTAPQGSQDRKRLTVKIVPNTKVVFLKGVDNKDYSFYGGDLNELEGDEISIFSEKSIVPNLTEQLSKLTTAHSRKGVTTINSTVKSRYLDSLVESTDRDQRVGSIFLSTNDLGHVQFYINLNYNMIVASRMRYGSLVKNCSMSLRQELIDACKISNMRLLRRRVTKDHRAPGAGFCTDTSRKRAEFDSAEVPQLICEHSDMKGSTDVKKYIQGKNPIKIGTIREVTSPGSGVRKFSGTDFEMSMINDGVYQYYLEITILDRTEKVLRQKLQILKALVINVEAAYAKLSVPVFNSSANHLDIIQARDELQPQVTPGGANKTEVPPSKDNIQGAYDPKTGFYAKKISGEIKVNRIENLIRLTMNSFFELLELLYPPKFQLKSFYRHEISTARNPQDMQLILEGSKEVIETKYLALRNARKEQMFSALQINSDNSPSYLRRFIQTCNSLVDTAGNYINPVADFNGMYSGEATFDNQATEISLVKYFNTYHDASLASKNLTAQMLPSSLYSGTEGLLTISMSDLLEHNRKQAELFQITEDQSLGWLLPVSYHYTPENNIEITPSGFNRTDMSNKIVYFGEGTDFSQVNRRLTHMFFDSYDISGHGTAGRHSGGVLAINTAASSANRSFANQAYAMTTMDTESEPRGKWNHMQSVLGVSVAATNKSIETISSDLEKLKTLKDKSLIASGDYEKLVAHIKKLNEKMYHARKHANESFDDEYSYITPSAKKLMRGMEQRKLNMGSETKSPSNMTTYKIKEKIQQFRESNPSAVNDVIPPMIESLVSGDVGYSIDQSDPSPYLSAFYHGMICRLCFVVPIVGRIDDPNVASSLTRQAYLQEESSILRPIAGVTVSELVDMVSRSTRTSYLMKIQKYSCEEIGIEQTIINKEVPISNQYFILEA